MTRTVPALLLLTAIELAHASEPQTTALWLFDEPQGLYPSSALDDSSANDHPLVIGLGGQVVEGRFGNGLSATPRPAIDVPPGEPAYEAMFGLGDPVAPDGGTVPMTWHNADFAALMTAGEKHLRKEVGFVNPSRSDLNLGDFDWTVEFWLNTEGAAASAPGVVFEIGEGPRAVDGAVNRLVLDAAGGVFVLESGSAGTDYRLETDAASLEGGWHHFAFEYESGAGELRHYVDGKPVSAADASGFKPVPEGDEAYLSLGRDANWQQPLPGVIDEVRFSRGQVYGSGFEAPASLAPSMPAQTLVRGPALLFAPDEDGPLQLGSRKHVFVDDAILESAEGVEFVVNPPRLAERVIDNIEGPFRKHLSVVEDEEGLIRIYNSVEKDYLQVYVSEDGVNFEAPDLGQGEIEGKRNIVIAENVGGLGNPFIDPNAPPEERWKYFTDFQRRGIYTYVSPDGYNWKRYDTAILPFRSGTQSCTFYDDQRGLYVSYHRSGIFHTPAFDTQRSSVVTEHEDLRVSLPFEPLSQQEYLDLRAEYPLRTPLPWYLDNGPLTPGGFGMEFPHRFDPDDRDPPGVDFYITKAMKYPWAPDTYLAFPIAYFHYEKDGPVGRQVLGDEERGRGSGPLESQVSVSRNGIDWSRYPDPAYVGIGRHEGRDVVTAYIANGMVRRGDEIWQYYFGETQYHSAHEKDEAGRGVYRLVQRLDGFVSLDSPYDREVTVTTRPLVFEGDRLELNIDTDAVGYAQVGFEDLDGNPIEGFSVDESVYFNGDFIAAGAEWLSGRQVSELQGQPVRVVLRMRGSKLYAMQFTTTASN